MAEKPHEKILHRELQIHDVQTYYSKQCQFLQDLVNYGTNLIPAALESSKKDLGDVIVISVLLKQVVRMLDSFEVLLTNGCGPSTALPARAAFEASIAIDWILVGDKLNKATYYYISNIRRQRIWTRRAIEGDQEQDRYFETLGEFGDHLKDIEGIEPNKIQDQLESLNRLLANDKYKSINDHFDKAKGKRKHEPAWHAPLGIRSVRALSEAVGRLHEYEIFYTHTSETIHGSQYKDHITINKGYIEFEPIRHIGDLSSSISFIATVALHSYQTILEAYRPGQVQEFSRRYARDWRDAFLNIKNIKYESTS